MRRAAKVDDNQAKVIEALREMGATVQPLHTIGKGCPDLLIGYKLVNILMEVKDGDKVESRRRLTADQKEWVSKWNGQWVEVKSPSEAVRFLNWYLAGKIPA